MLQIASQHFRRYRHLAWLWCVLALTLPSGGTNAASTTATFNVTASVVDSCAVSASELAFGTYDPTAAADKTAVTTLTVTCSLGTPYTISLNDGTHASGGSRRLAVGSSHLSYQIYKDALATQVFGTAAALLGVSGLGTGLAVPTVIYGVIPKAQNVAVGNYSDQITVTVEY